MKPSEILADEATCWKSYVCDKLISSINDFKSGNAIVTKL